MLGTEQPLAELERLAVERLRGNVVAAGPMQQGQIVQRGGHVRVVVNYDFVPGARVIWAEDFARDRVGDFPRRVELMRGNFEVAE